MPRDKRILNAMKRSEVHKKEKREKAQAKLKKRMEVSCNIHCRTSNCTPWSKLLNINASWLLHLFFLIHQIRKLEREGPDGEKAREARLAKNVPRTLDNTRQFDSTSYLTADPSTAASLAARSRMQSKKAAKAIEPAQDSSEEDSQAEEDEQVDENGAGPSSRRKSKAKAQDDPEEDEEMEQGDEEQEPEQDAAQSSPFPTGIVSDKPPRILLTTSPHATQATHAFMGDLKSVFPGGEVYKRLKGRGFELGRVARWAAKRDFKAMVVVNEDHKTPNAITIINLPAGPTAYFKLTSIALGREIVGHARPSPHSPELILNNFSTLLGLNIGRLFGSLFPPMPQFRGRQVVTLHNQRDFLFFRRHRYMFASTEKARLQEIGPRFTLKLRWLRKGLPSVLAADGVAPRSGDRAENENNARENDEAVSSGDDEQDDGHMDVEMERTEGATVDQDNVQDGPSTSRENKASNGQRIPELDEEQEYEWKWKVGHFTF